MKRNAKILVAGGTGMVGSAIIRKLLTLGYENIISTYHSRGLITNNGLRVAFLKLDLTRQAEVEAFFESEKPEYVFLAAAKVGGILANNTYPADFIHINLMIQNNVIHNAHRNGVKRLLFLGSSCIYPKLSPQPMKEEYLLTGELEPTNEPYAVAKIAGIKMCESYNRQYGTKFFSVMPTNLYGPNDNFDLLNSHVLPALIRKFHEAKAAQAAEVFVWGTGNPRREFLHVDDMADACFFIMDLSDECIDDLFFRYPGPSFVNIGMGEDVAIRELAGLVKEVVGFKGEIVFDPAKPDGTPRKLLDVSRIKALGWSPGIDLRKGIESTYQWFLENIHSVQ